MRQFRHSLEWIAELTWTKILGCCVVFAIAVNVALIVVVVALMAFGAQFSFPSWVNWLTVLSSAATFVGFAIVAIGRR